MCIRILTVIIQPEFTQIYLRQWKVQILFIGLNEKPENHCNIGFVFFQQSKVRVSSGK